ncbi:hypothetical protein BDZ97DRAFT_1348705 [Flammula alnicola]|nr:hypothetical protein BDZ97DRAFT_91870 [Flammula alnicola]KAF8971238.1 hypothetical protein BDZ97DRAFT_1348705 [Flammula alnicola]
MLLETTLSGTEQLLYFVTFLLPWLRSPSCGCNLYHSSSQQLPSLLQEPSFSCYDGSLGLGPEGEIRLFSRLSSFTSPSCCR